MCWGYDSAPRPLEFMKKPKSKNQKPETEALTPRAQFLAQNHTAAEVQRENIKQLRKSIVDFRTALRESSIGMVKLAEKGRQIGLIVLELAESFPGRRITEDFWRQLPELFTDSHGQKITLEMLMWFAKIAKGNPEPIADVMEAKRNLQLLLMASGEKEFVLEAERSPQMAHAPRDTLATVKQLLDYGEFKEAFEALKADARYYPGGRIRPDLRDTLRVELAPAIVIVQTFARELAL